MTWGSLGPKLDRFEFIYWYTGPCSPCSTRTSLLACSIAKYFWNARSKEKSAGFTFNISVIIFESRMPESNQSQSRLALIASTNLHSVAKCFKMATVADCLTGIPSRLSSYLRWPFRFESLLHLLHDDSMRNGVILKLRWGHWILCDLVSFHWEICLKYGFFV